MTLLQDQKVRQFAEKMNAEQKALMLTLMIAKHSTPDIALIIDRVKTGAQIITLVKQLQHESPAQTPA